MKANNLTIEQYVDCVKICLQIRGLAATNEVNHQLLNEGKISKEQFQAAARELAKEIIKR